MIYFPTKIFYLRPKASRYMSANVRLCPSVCLSVFLSVCAHFLTKFPLSDHHEIAMVDALG